MLDYKLFRKWKNRKMSIEIKVSCKKCGEPISFLELDRMRRAYLTLTRKSRANSYNVKCIKCGKVCSLRVPPDMSYSHICKNCSRRIEKKLDKGDYQRK